MRDLEWTSFYNEFSRTRGQQAKSHGLVFKIAPDGIYTCLKLLNSYTGVELKFLRFEHYNEAVQMAESINYKLELGYSIELLI